ncbi:MAG: NAD(P)H-dependent oxidoreductase [Spirochaetota bacterium]
MKTILAIGASSSSKSINRTFAKWIGEQLAAESLLVPDLNTYEMPIYSIDREEEIGFPEAAHRLKELIQQADGIIISFAEHNGAWTAAFKNLVDWLSRMERSIWLDKPVFLAATSPGKRGARSSLDLAHTLMPYQGAKVVASFSLPSWNENFQDGIVDKDLRVSFETELDLFRRSVLSRGVKRQQKPHNQIQYIVSQEVREELQPFVFWDAGKPQIAEKELVIPSHHHSGIGIITYFAGSELIHSDSAGNDTVIASGGSQWICAGSGIWHEERYRKLLTESAEDMAIYQLWLALPPDWEQADPAYQNVQPEELPVLDGVKVIAGSYKGKTSPLQTPFDITYLDVELAGEELFHFTSPSGQNRGILFLKQGLIKVAGEIVEPGVLVILQDNDGSIEIEAQEQSDFLLLTCLATEQGIYTAGGSIHSNRELLQQMQVKSRGL